jgi:hypothetical protein
MDTSTITPDQSTDDLESRRRLAVALGVAAQQAMQGSSASTPSDGSAPDATPEGDGSSSSDLVKALSAQAPAQQPNQRVLDLRKQADAIPATGVDEPSNWKQALFNAATKILPVALTARFAGTAAGAGAGQGEMNATRQFALDQQNRRTQLLQEAQQAEQEDEKQREFSLEDQTRRAQIADAAARAQQAEADRQSDLQERGREFNLNRQDRLNTATSAADRSKQEDARTLAIAGLTRDASGNIVPLPKSGLALTKQNELDKPDKAQGTGTFSLAEDGNGNPVLFNSKTGDTKPAPNGLHKPNAEEVKRGDLSENVNENLDALEDIVKRRPELFGAVGGRMTQAKQFIGTNDPDVAQLNMIKDNLGKALQSAHGMRNAMAVEATGNAVLNSFKNGPDAILAASGSARKSVATFLKDIQQGNPAIPKGAKTFTPKSSNSTADPLGVR